MKELDHRYEVAGIMLMRLKLTFQDIFKYIPKTVVAKDLGKKVDAFNLLIANPSGLKIEEIYIIASWMKCPPEAIYVAIGRQRQNAGLRPRLTDLGREWLNEWELLYGN